jgi:hypothetical protein
MISTPTKKNCEKHSPNSPNFEGKKNQNGHIFTTGSSK